MTSDPLADAAAAYLDAVARHKAAVAAAKRAARKRAALAAEVEEKRQPMQEQIIEAGRARRRPAEIARLTRYTPERVRQLLRAAGVEPFERHDDTEP